MEFNRLLSSAISLYGEPKLTNEKKDINLESKQKDISKKNYYLIKNEKLTFFI